MTVSSPASERPVPVVTLFAAVDALRPMVACKSITPPIVLPAFSPRKAGPSSAA
jgi:hypothetical protein